MTPAIQPSAPLAPTALSKTGPLNASNLVCMILQANKVELEGFDNPKVNVFAPGVRFVGLNKNGRPSNGLEEIAWQGSRNRKVLLVCAAMLCVTLVLASVLFRLAGASEFHHQKTMPMSWTAQSVESTGLRVRSGSSEVVIPVGSRLPNGELLLSVSYERKTYSTPNGVTTLSSNSK